MRKIKGYILGMMLVCSAVPSWGSSESEKMDEYKIGFPGKSDGGKIPSSSFEGNEIDSEQKISCEVKKIESKGALANYPVDNKDVLLFFRVKVTIGNQVFKGIECHDPTDRKIPDDLMKGVCSGVGYQSPFGDNERSFLAVENSRYFPPTPEGMKALLELVR
ncbi:MAG: hypothetical protein GY915_00660 [bacterium]|nr:hypothetical protein [bacterium]